MSLLKSLGNLKELKRTREENNALATQYPNLLAKLATMRTTLGNLQHDTELGISLLPLLVSSVDEWASSLNAKEELEGQEQLVQQLTAQNDVLAATVEPTLRSEIGRASCRERVCLYV